METAWLDESDLSIMNESSGVSVDDEPIGKVHKMQPGRTHASSVNVME